MPAESIEDGLASRFPILMFVPPRGLVLAFGVPSCQPGDGSLVDWDATEVSWERVAPGESVRGAEELVKPLQIAPALGGLGQSWDGPFVTDADGTPRAGDVVRVERVRSIEAAVEFRWADPVRDGHAPQTASELAASRRALARGLVDVEPWGGLARWTEAEVAVSAAVAADVPLAEPAYVILPRWDPQDDPAAVAASAAWPEGQATAAPAAEPPVAARLWRQDAPDGTLAIGWEVRNTSPEPVWLPARWTLRDGQPRQGEFPVPILVPPRGLMLLMGWAGDDGDEDEPERPLELEHRVLQPGEALVGRVELPLPLQVPESPLYGDWGPLFVFNPRAPIGLFGPPDTIRAERLASIELAVAVWRTDPARNGHVPRSPQERSAYRQAVAEALFGGRYLGEERPLQDELWSRPELVTAPVLRETVPLAAPVLVVVPEWIQNGDLASAIRAWAAWPAAPNGESDD